MAAIAAGILVEVDGDLQDRSEETGADLSKQVSDRVEVISEIGWADQFNPDSTGVGLHLQREPVAADIDVGNMTVHWVSPVGFGRVLFAPEYP